MFPRSISAPAPAGSRSVPRASGRGARRWAFPFGNAAAVLLLLLGAAPAAAQLAPAVLWEGPYDYVTAGASLRTGSNSGSPCSVGSSATATVAGVPAGATVVGAYLYWAGSGWPDNTVTFAGSGVSAQRSWTDTYSLSGTNFNFFGAFADVTSRVSGNGSYSLSNLSVSTGTPYCASQAVLAGFTLYVVYRADGASPRRVQLHDGFQVLRDQSSTVTLSGFTGAASPSVRLTVQVWEGDSDISGDERVRWNGSTVHFGTNVWNSTANGASNVHGLDLDSYTPSLGAGASSASLQVQTGTDLVILQATATSIAVAPSYAVAVTPDGGTVQRLPGSGYTLTFTIANTSNRDIVAGMVVAGGGTPFFVVPTGIGGPGVTGTARPDSFNVAIPFGGTATLTVTYSVPQGPNATNTGGLRARVAAQPTTFDDGFAEIERVSPQLTLQKSVSPTGVVARGAELTYEMAFANEGEYEATAVSVVDEVPAEVAFKLGSAAQTLPGSLTATVAYSDDGGATWTYTPASGGCSAPAGYDGCVRRVRWTLSGPLPAGTAASSGTVRFVAVIR